MSKRAVSTYGTDTVRYSGSQFEGDKLVNYRGFRQDISPIIDRVSSIAEAVNSRGAHEKKDWRYVGSIPMSMLVDWCAKNRYSYNDWATNRDGAKDKFKKWFLTRNHAKLHTEHVTTKPIK